MESITLEIYWKVSANEIYSGKHWTKRNEHKICWLGAYVKRLKELRKYNEVVDIDFTYYFRNSPLDSDNCSYMTKLFIDCMVKAEVLQNDTIKYVGRVSMESKKTTGNIDSVLIEITDHLTTI